MCEYWHAVMHQRGLDYNSYQERINALDEVFDVNNVTLYRDLPLLSELFHYNGEHAPAATATVATAGATSDLEQMGNTPLLLLRQ